MLSGSLPPRSDIYHHVVSTFHRSLNLSGIKRQIEFLMQRESIAHLDLALCSPLSTKWKSFEVQSLLSAQTREYFLAEVLDESENFPSLLRSAITLNESHLEEYERKLDTLNLFTRFERVLFNQIADKDDVVKKQNVFKYLKAFEVFDFDRFVSMYRFLIRLCIPLDCELTLNVVKTLCRTDFKKLHVFCSVWNERSLITLIEYAKTMKFDFWGIWSGSSTLAGEFNFVHGYMNFGINQEYSRILLQFGFPYQANYIGLKERCDSMEELVFHGQQRVLRTEKPLLGLTRGGYVFGETRDSYKTRMMLILDTFTIFGNFYDSVHIENCVRTLVYLTRTLPDPYVTPSELYSTMQGVVVPEFLPHLRAIAEKYSEAAIFETEYENYSPRRLMHLCRVVTRKRLATNFKLLDGIEELNIPTIFKSYLRLER